MSESRPGIIQYTDNVKENMGGNFVNALFFKVLENRPISQQIHWYMKNIDSQNITYTLSDGKNEKLAKKHREKGNGLFANNEFAAALSLYNQSIAFGVKSENLSLCYANRSAVYFELGMFQKCLENIERAKKLKFPAHLLPKLDKRADDATRGLLASENVNMKFDCFNQLSKPASKDLPFLIDCLEGSDLDDLPNRRIRTKNALAAGDVISKETKPFSAVLKPKLIFSHCGYCLSTDAAMSLIPCKFCSTAMFCNEDCYKKANDLFHKFECPIIDAIYGMLSESMWLGLRTVLMALSICGSLEKFENFLTAVYEKKENIFEQIFEQVVPENVAVDLCDLERFRAIMNLPVNGEFNLEDCAGTAFAMKLLTENTKLIDRDNVKAVEFIAVAIYKSMNIARCNAVLLEETYSMIGLTNEITFYGRALFPFASNFNLSCAPNVLLLNYNKSMLGVVMRPIPSGGTLYAGLASLNHITGDRNYRQGLKQQHLGITCECIACKRNFGRMENLRPDPNVEQPTLPSDMALAGLLDPSATLQQYKFLCDYLNKHSDLKYLTFQVAGAINQLLFTLGKMAHPPAIEMKLGESLGEKL